MVTASVPRLLSMSNRTLSALASKRNAASAAGGARSTDTIGNIAVNPAARAKSARAMRANIGTTGAKGATASNTIATDVSRLRPNHTVAAAVSAGTTTKLTIRTNVKRHWL